MALPNITTKIINSDDYNERKILASDVNQIKQAIQTGVLDIKPSDIHMEGNVITADGGQNWIRRSGNKFQYYDAGTWKEITANTNTATFTAGENIAIRNVVYLKVSDGKIYKASNTNYDWIGVAKQAITKGATGEVYLNNSVVGGFSSLTPGRWYKVNASAGTINASDLSITNTQYNVGVAVSATQIILIKNQLNGITNTINELPRIYYKTYSSAAEVSISENSWTDTAKTFTITHPANTILIGIYFEGQIKTSHYQVPCVARIHISGTTLGSVYTERLADVRWYIGTGISAQSNWFYSISTSYETQIVNAITNYLLPDTSTTFTVQLASQHAVAGYIVSIQNVVIRLILANAVDLG